MATIETLMSWGNLAKEWVPVIRDFVLMYVGWQGLHTWRRQLVGTKKHDAAEKLLETAYELRDSIRAVRCPAWFSNEAGDRPRSDQEDRHESHANDWIYAYQRRIMEVQRKRNDFRIAALKGRVRLGKQVKEIEASLDGLTAELIAHHYSWCYKLGEGKDVGPEDRTLFSDGDADEFSKKVNQAVECVDAFCERWLR